MADKFQIKIQDTDLNTVTIQVSKDMKIKEVKELYYGKTGKKKIAISLCCFIMLKN